MATLVFNEYSETLRQMPENYLIAHADDFKYKRWVCEPDLAADKAICLKVFMALLEYENKYQKDGNVLVDIINKKDNVLLEGAYYVISKLS